jgi:4'-phosphopantetheinyl transferase
MPDEPLASLPCRVELSTPDIEAWLMPLGAHARRVEQCAALLSRDEQARAERFHFERDRRRYTFARGMLRVLLGNRLGVAPTAIEFHYAQHGKPSVTSATAPIHFNLSHSADTAIYAISSSRIPGVDIEHLNRDVEIDALAQRFFTHRECAELQSIPTADRKRAFLAAWTRKEAIVKSTGDGLRLPLDQIEVTVALDAPPKLLSIMGGRGANWTLYSVDAGRDYVATVAAYRPPA